MDTQESILPPFSNISEQYPKDEKMKDEKDESCCINSMECCLPCALFCFLLEK